MRRRRQPQLRAPPNKSAPPTVLATAPQLHRTDLVPPHGTALSDDTSIYIGTKTSARLLPF